MLKKLRLQRFKNFKEAELILGPLTLLAGRNASGKSNIGDAFRFLHGISRNYNLAEIFGEKWIESGALQWRGIRSGTREITFQGAETFVLEVSFALGEDREQEAIYRIEVAPGNNDTSPKLIAESLAVEGQKTSIFEATLVDKKGQNDLSVRVQGTLINDPNIPFNNYRPVISQLVAPPYSSVITVVKATISALSSMQFLDLNPDAMRMPSLPSQAVLGDRGENLSSVLQRICEDPQGKQALIRWIQEFTAMDVIDLEFTTDFTGKILLTLVEEKGQKTSAISASDGTLRFLAIIAALQGPEPAQFYFLEEQDNSIHPTRLHLLLELIERNGYQRNIQIVATTYSSQLLRLINQTTL